jgi:hypothetical protein
VEAEVDELKALAIARLREKGKELGVVPVGDKRKTEVWRVNEELGGNFGNK